MNGKIQAQLSKGLCCNQFTTVIYSFSRISTCIYYLNASLSFMSSILITAVNYSCNFVCKTGTKIPNCLLKPHRVLEEGERSVQKDPIEVA
jgi:hypothetical protein